LAKHWLNVGIHWGYVGAMLRRILLLGVSRSREQQVSDDFVLIMPALQPVRFVSYLKDIC